VPATLRFLGFDPALAAGIFVTMLTDLLGFLTFLGLAALLISEIQ
jgi:magnesium transporter